MSGQLRYRLHFMHDWRGGTRGMSFELQGAYNDICDEITIQEGPAKLDLQEMARRGGTNARAVKRLVDELVERGKLIADEDGRYRNGRANRDVETALVAIAAKGQVSAKHDSRQSNSKPHVWPKVWAKHEKSLPQTLPETLGETAPENIVNSTEDPSYARVNDRARDRAVTSILKGGAPPFDQAGRAALPTSEVSSSASEARNETGYAAQQPDPRAARSPATDGLSLARSAQAGAYRRTNDWDMPVAPGPTGQTKFLKAFEAWKAGDMHALDPLPGIPWASSNPALSAKIRTQLGWPLPEDNHETDPPADQDDHGFAQRHERTPDPDGSEADQAGPRNGDPEASPREFAAKHADPRKPNDETKPPLSDEDFGGLP